MSERLNWTTVALVGIVCASFLGALGILGYLLAHLPPTTLTQVLSANFLTAVAGVITALAGFAAALWGAMRREGLLHPRPTRAERAGRAP